MRYYQLEDPFKYKQPEITFTKELSKPVHLQKPPRWNELPLSENEVDFSLINLDVKFYDEVLETAYADFNNFLQIVGIKADKNGKLFTVEKGETECFEAYVIKVTEQGVTITANDTEGIRRALFYVEDEMHRLEGSRLKIGTISRKPFIKSRISRCYFTPASTVAIEEKENELITGIDYYPDEYLNRLAHDGINALWLGATFQYLVKSDIIPDYGKDAEKRMAKLNEVIEKCRRYGIKTYLFSVDPASTYCNDKLLNYPDIISDETSGWLRRICPSTEKGVAYIKEAVTKIFTQAPGLAGYINLNLGEMLSTCASKATLTCSRCIKKFKTTANALAFVEKTICDTIKAVNPNAEYIAWNYELRGLKSNEVKDLCEARDKNVIQLVNFEDHGELIQLGRKRYCNDYWLSFVGPGELFKECVAHNKRLNKPLWAKIQVCSSHEISTVPYVPVPGILYDKYKYLYENGIQGVMQCWFFGNYPCLMNKAASELSFEPTFKSKKEFLIHLAGIYWGRDAEKVASIWEEITEAYKNFPLSVNFEWYSPMQDSPCAPYHLRPIDLALPSTWLLDDMVGGDRVFDCVTNSHTTNEILTLCSTMTEGFEKGFEKLSKIDKLGYYAREEQAVVVNAIALIFRSGVNTFKFYDLRNKLALNKGNPTEILEKMRSIVLEEIEISSILIPITENDNRIGYHSEAHGYKIFPEKLKWRIEEMQKLLKTEFSEVADRIKNNLKPLPFYYGEEDGARCYNITASDINSAKFMNFLTEDGVESENTKVRVSKGEDSYTVEVLLNGVGDSVKIDPEFKIFSRLCPINLRNGKLEIDNSMGYSMMGEYADEYRKNFTWSYQNNGDSESYVFSFKPENYGASMGDPFRMDIKRKGKFNESFAKDDRMFLRLVLNYFSPDALGFFITK